MESIEIWKDIKGYEGLYQISNFGRVKNSNGLVMKDRYDKDGYKRISFTRTLDNVRSVKTFLIHRLVAKHFISNPNNYNVVNHIDEDKENNHESNLEWCTRKYNNTYGSRANVFNNRKRRKVIDLTNNIIYKNLAEAGRENNVTSGSIYNVCTGRNKTSNGNRFMFYDEFLTIQEAI